VNKYGDIFSRVIPGTFLKSFDSAEQFALLIATV
jgi:hypothetical protein